jgi:glyoxylase-like metal-dependent hydrolase (beta-lactamase superfamily II)
VAIAFRAGALDCRMLVDGEGTLPLELLFAGAPEADRPTGADVLIPYQCLLVLGGETVVLIDTGIGPYEHPCGGSGGHLGRELAAHGVAPADVGLVVLTHAHLDHVGGLCADGMPRFASARHVMARAERERVSTGEFPVPDEQLPPVERAGLLELVDGEAEPVPGIRLLPAPGHTCGHMAVEIGGAALFLADVIADERHAEHPDWTMGFDDDPEQNVRTRRALLGRAAAEGLLVAASHVRRTL